MNRGFTVVEILVTLIIMTILLTLGTVGIRSSLANARDAERADDIATIARGLEQYYKRGNQYYIGTGSTQGTYPGSNTMMSISGAGWCNTATIENSTEAAKFSVCKPYFSDALPGVTTSALTPPDRSTIGFQDPWQTPDSTTNVLITSWMQTEINAGKYIYKPMYSDSYQLCYDDTNCSRYALFYKKETTGETVTVWSTHR